MIGLPFDLHCFHMRACTEIVRKLRIGQLIAVALMPSKHLSFISYTIKKSIYVEFFCTNFQGTRTKSIAHIKQAILL